MARIDHRAFRRADIEAQIETLIDILDEIDGDPDLEDATDLEDDFAFSRRAQQVHRTLGPGCPLSDPDKAIDDDGCDDINDDREEEWPEGEFSDPEARAEHLRRIRQTRCTPKMVERYDWNQRRRLLEVSVYRLNDDPYVPTRRQLLRRRATNKRRIAAPLFAR